MDENVPEHPSKGFIFLFILSTIVWFAIGIHNNPDDSIFGVLFVALLLGGISAVALTILFVLMKRMFKW